MVDFLHFMKDALRLATTGSWRYHLAMALLTALVGFGVFCYAIQLRDGLVVTGMNDIVSWGLYISNFTFLVGLAAASVMLVLPSYILHDVDFRKSVLIAEGVAVSALIMCLLFVTVDLGRPDRFWHMIPVIGYFNWPDSMLTWDVLVLWGYLGLNTLIPLYLIFSHYCGRRPDKRKYLPFVVLSVFWAVSIHLVTAFLYAGLPARPWWNSSLLGPRFLASAFAAGPAFIILTLALIRRYTEMKVTESSLHKLALIMTVAAQVNLIMLGSELFKEFYSPTEHSQSAYYLFFGLEGHNSLVPWIWTALGMNLLATTILTLNPLRRRLGWCYFASVVLFVSIWIDKGMGLIVPGFIPDPFHRIVDYAPTYVEIGVSLGIWGVGLLVLMVLIKVALPIELGKVRAPGAPSVPGS